jgi:SPP1 gp7 family putative phage head morphogenesis protein
MKKEDIELEASVARIRNRVAVPKYYYDKLPKDIRSLAFYVSGLEKLREIEMVKKSLENAIKQGESFESWKANLNIEGLKNLSNYRLETVYRNNVNTVYNQSTRFNALSSDVTPYLMYSAVGDERTRPEHEKLDGIVKRADSEFWDKYTGPWAWGCRCSAIPLTKEDAEEIGISKRANNSFPDPEQGFGSKGYGDVLTGTKKAAEDAVKSLPNNSPYKDKFEEALSNIKNLVDIWFNKNQDVFRN